MLDTIELDSKKIRLNSSENEEAFKAQCILIWDVLSILYGLTQKNIKTLLSNDQFLKYQNHDLVNHLFELVKLTFQFSLIFLKILKLLQAAADIVCFGALENCSQCTYGLLKFKYKLSLILNKRIKFN
jgi:hypothetical protein